MEALLLSEGVRIFAENSVIQALANFFGLLAGGLIIFSILRASLKAGISVYHTSIRTTIVEAKLLDIRKALYAGRDMHLYISELARHGVKAAIFLTILVILPFGIEGAIPFSILVFWNLWRALILARRVERIREWMQACSNADFHGHPHPRLRNYLS